MRADGRPKCTKEEIQILTEPPAPLEGFIVVGLMHGGGTDLTADTPDVAQICMVLSQVVHDLMEANQGVLLTEEPDESHRD